MLIQAALGFDVLPKELLRLKHPVQSTGTGRTEGHKSVQSPFSHAASCSAPGPCRGWTAQLALGALLHTPGERRAKQGAALERRHGAAKQEKSGGTKHAGGWKRLGWEGGASAGLVEQQGTEQEA